MHGRTAARRFAWLCCLALSAACRAADGPPLMLAEVYDGRGAIDFADYRVSEKLDGIRGYWDGEKLLTRSGHVIPAPAWFTAGWPRVPLDGELWAGRGRFSHASSTVRTQTPDDDAWRQMRFMVFDLPAAGGPFSERLAALDALLASLQIPWLQPVKQTRVADRAALKTMLEQVVAQGGEGLMLHRGSSLYRPGRSDDLLKYKPYEDAEAKVVAYVPGKGKYEGMLGALLVERPDGLRFRIGTGFTDEQRRHPPPIGSWITYAYNGYTVSGLPRFARFLRIREDFDLAAAGR